MALPYPPPVRWLIGIELTRFRHEAKLSMSKTAALAGMTKSKLANLEGARQGISEDDIERLLSVYGAEQRNVTRLISLVRRADEANWWRDWADAVLPWFQVYVGLERLATRACVYEPILIHGLLQTPEYARLVASESMLVRADHIERVVEFRMARAARFKDPERPLWLHVVMGAGALDKVIGSPEVYERQMMHLAKMADLPTVTIQVLPREAGLLAVHATGGFTLLDLDTDSQVGYIELLDDAVYLHERARLQTYRVAFRDLEQQALDPERSLALIRSKIVG